MISEMICDICGEEKEGWECFRYQGGLVKCKIHSKGYAKSHKKKKLKRGEGNSSQA